VKDEVRRGHLSWLCIVWGLVCVRAGWRVAGGVVCVAQGCRPHLPSSVSPAAAGRGCCVRLPCCKGRRPRPSWRPRFFSARAAFSLAPAALCLAVFCAQSARAASPCAPAASRASCFTLSSSSSSSSPPDDSTWAGSPKGSSSLASCSLSSCSLFCLMRSRSEILGRFALFFPFFELCSLANFASLRRCPFPFPARPRTQSDKSDTKSFVLLASLRGEEFDRRCAQHLHQPPVTACCGWRPWRVAPRAQAFEQVCCWSPFSCDACACEKNMHVQINCKKKKKQCTVEWTWNGQPLCRRVHSTERNSNL